MARLGVDRSPFSHYAGCARLYAPAGLREQNIVVREAMWSVEREDSNATVVSVWRELVGCDVSVAAAGALGTNGVASSTLGWLARLATRGAPTGSAGQRWKTTGRWPIGLLLGPTGCPLLHTITVPHSFNRNKSASSRPHCPQLARSHSYSRCILKTWPTRYVLSHSHHH